MIDQSDVAKCHCQSLRKHHLVWVTPIHGCTRVDRNDKREILFFKEDLQEQSIKASKDVPIDETKVITVNVRAEVSEFNALPSTLGAAFALNLASEDLAAHHIKLTDARHQCCINEIIHSLRALATWLPLEEQAHAPPSGT